MTKKVDELFAPWDRADSAGDEHLYCNTGYTLLALVVRHVTGQSLRDAAAVLGDSPRQLREL